MKDSADDESGHSSLLGEQQGHDCSWFYNPSWATLKDHLLIWFSLCKRPYVVICTKQHNIMVQQDFLYFILIIARYFCMRQTKSSEIFLWMELFFYIIIIIYCIAIYMHFCFRSKFFFSSSFSSRLGVILDFFLYSCFPQVDINDKAFNLYQQNICVFWNIKWRSEIQSSMVTGHTLRCSARRIPEVWF